jgi:hypothetical protein
MTGQLLDQLYCLTSEAVETDVTISGFTPFNRQRFSHSSTCALIAHDNKIIR